MAQPNPLAMTLQHLPVLGHHIHPPTNQHPVFDNAAVLKRIFKNLEPRSLFYAALTCTSFKDPALDSLWNSLGSLLPLLKLLRPFKLINGTYVFQGPFDEGEWPIFDAYARRVKQLTLTTDAGGDIIASSTYQRLSRRRPCLLPGLEDLICPSVLPTHTPLFSLLSPTIERLELGGDQAAYDELIEPAVSTITSESEESRLNLKRLVLLGNPSPNLLDSLCQLSNLLQLSISGAVSFKFFKEVGKLEHLENLTITLSASRQLPLDETVGFRKLRTLHIKSPDTSLQMALQGIHTTHLISINITAICTTQTLNRRSISWKQPARNPFLDCFKILDSRWRSSLQSITVDQDESIYRFDSIPSDLFSRFSCFEKLEHLQFYHFFPTDAGIHSLALAFPNLQRLYLPIDCPDPSMALGSVSSLHNTTFDERVGLGDVDDIESSQSQTTTTIVALWSLAELCPSLTHLQIGLDVTTIPAFFDSTVHSHGLACLSVGSYQSTSVGLTRAFEIARHIDRLFPNLKIESHDGHNSTIWDQIGYTVDAYKKVRLDENTRRLRQSAIISQSTRFLSH